MSSSFLALPAELRVKVYQLLSASSCERPIKIHHDKGGHSGTYAALARVNRQVRDEYIQEHRRIAHISVPYSDIQEPSLFSRSPIENLQIRLSYLNPSELEYVDLLPLLENKAQFGSNFTCTFVNILRPFHNPPVITDSGGMNYEDWSYLDTWTLWLNSFLAHANTVWERIILDVESELAAVSLRIHENPPHLRLIFKLEHPSGDPTWGDMQETYLPMMGMGKGAKPWFISSDFRTWRLSILSMDKEARVKAGMIR